MSLYVTPDPQSIRDAEEREHRETYAQSSIVSITRESADERRRREFWEAVDAQRVHHHARTRTLKLVRNV